MVKITRYRLLMARNNIILMAGRTGGPLTPLLAMSTHLPYRPFVLGVRGGYEEKVARTQGYPFLPLPATKLSALSFAGNRSKLLLELPKQLALLVWALILSLIYVFQHQPVAVLGAGGFTSVPMTLAVRLYRLLGNDTRIVIHQQDPLVGVANKVALRLADTRSYVYQTSLQSGLLDAARQIPNPIQIERYSSEALRGLESEFSKLTTFLNNRSKPVLLVFGGGSGAKVINDWVVANAPALLPQFAIVHLTGLLQDTPLEPLEHPDYWRQEFAFTEMPLLMHHADVVLCRAGLGSISELMYLQKPAFLVPLAGSHQELNAKEVIDYFVVLNQNQTGDWVNTITTHYPDYFDNISWPSRDAYRQALYEYYAFVEQSIDK